MEANERTTIPTLLRAAAQAWGEQVAISDEQTAWPTQLTWDGLLDSVRHFAAALHGRGVRHGDCVAIWAPNTHHWIISALGAQYIGAIVVPINTRYTDGEALDIIVRSSAGTLVIVGDFLGKRRLPELLAQCDGAPGSVKTIIEVPYEAPVQSSTLSTSWLDFLDTATPALLASADDASKLVHTDDIADILFTSGTTGKSKGVLATHDQTVHVGRIWGTIATLHPEDCYMLLSPFFHTFGYKAGFIACLYHGVRMVPQSVFRVDNVIDLAEKHRVSVLAGAPTIFQSILDTELHRTRDLTHLRVAVTGATTVPVTLVERLQDQLGVDIVLTAYGLTETSGYVCSTRPEDSPHTVATTCGRPIDGMQVKLDHTGELLVRGRLVMRSYLDDPHATAAAIDSEGWLHTGDIATISPEGNIAITDRIKDMFITGGFNVYPAEVEQAILAVPGVRECAVIGVHDTRMGEVGKAFVCTSISDASIDERIRAQCNALLAKFKIPHYIEVVDALPRNTSGKVDKLQLRQRG
ncbi:hypothetical protein BJD99_03575 [Rhodococcus sp. 1163]|uniref:AMP-binding protein n=1 Tax=unclassified Rhodococcus (in: high G+C Gram-positive bacteria) TaxID=192944 RepID=UPI000A00176B|nr:AMP-binding protein [Rhodococcus sp. 1163]ORI14919.1 hypothetical protein BJD99_03575 [Rhodococcus sp. 1163]